MATISLSSTMRSLLKSTVFGPDSSSRPQNLGGRFSGNDGYAFIRFMSGTIPSDFSGLTNGAALSSQVLWESDNIWSSHGSLSDWANGYLQTTYSAATQTGTVEWFWYFANQNTTSTSGNTIGNIIGSVTATGGGGDITVPSTTITSGKNYRVDQWRLDFAEDYTY